MNLWLDDIRDPSSFGCIGYTWVKTAQEAIALLETGEVVKASLDHDLSLKATLGDWAHEETGYDVILWLEENPSFWPPRGVRVHSANTVGRQRMQVVIDRHYDCIFCN